MHSERVTEFDATLGLDQDHVYPDVERRVEALTDLLLTDPDVFWRVVRGMVTMLDDLGARCTSEDGESGVWVAVEPDGEGRHIPMTFGSLNAPGELAPILGEDELSLLHAMGGSVAPGDVDATAVDLLSKVALR